MQCEIQTSDLNYGCAEFWKTSAMFTVLGGAIAVAYPKAKTG